MEFRTKLDFTTRQVKQNPETFANLSGGTSFGLTFSALTTGPNLSTTALTSTVLGVASTFSGNTGTTTYSWYDSAMVLGELYLSALTPTNSATTQNTGIIFTSNTTTIIDGNSITLTYSGISFDLTPLTIVDLGGGAYSGTAYSDELNFYSAGTLDYTGRTIWADISGITRTERLIITNLGSGPGLLDVGIDGNGFLVNNASDIKLKENIETIEGALDKVLNLRGVTYNWKDRIGGGNATKLGFIAQEVEGVVPELTYDDGVFKSVYYKDISALLVEAIKELVTNTSIAINNKKINTQTVVAEDNNIELNYNGDHQSSIGGGLIVLHAKNNDEHTVFETDSNGDWVTNSNLKPIGLVIPTYTPLSSQDSNGILGNITKDNDYLYLKTENGWKRINLESF